MIFGNVKHLNNYSNLDEKLLKCFEYAKENDLRNFKSDSYEIDGRDIFVNIVEYDTFEKEDRFWEAHRKYIDIHLMLEGCERIDINFIENMKIKEYKEDADFVSLDGEINGYVDLQVGDFLICYPEDAHMTALQVNGKEHAKKAIFKIIL